MSPRLLDFICKYDRKLTVRFLVTSSGSGSTKLLGLVPAGIGNKEGSVELDKDVLDLLLGLLINVLLVVRYQRLKENITSKAIK